jgi:hypothetical protein
LFGFELEAGTDGPKKSCNNSGAKVLTPEPFFGVVVVVVVNFLMLPLWLFMSPFLNPLRVTVTTHTIDPASGCLPTSFLPFITSNFFFFVGTSIILFDSPFFRPVHKSLFVALVFLILLILIHLDCVSSWR